MVVVFKFSGAVEKLISLNFCNEKLMVLSNLQGGCDIRRSVSWSFDKDELCDTKDRSNLQAVCSCAHRLCHQFCVANCICFGISDLEHNICVLDIYPSDVRVQRDSKIKRRQRKKGVGSIKIFGRGSRWECVYLPRTRKLDYSRCKLFRE